MPPSEPPSRTQWLLIGAAVALLALAFWAGRQSNPSRVEEKVRVERVEVEKVVVQVEEKVRVERVIVERTRTNVVEREVTRPDGTVEKTREEQVQADSRESDAESREFAASEARERAAQEDLESSRVASYALPRWRLGATAGVLPFAAWRPTYGAEAGVRVAGPFWISLSGRSDGSIAATVAIEF